MKVTAHFLVMWIDEHMDRHRMWIDIQCEDEGNARRKEFDINEEITD